MATQSQVEFFQLLYDKEEERLKTLRGLATAYLGFSSLYIGFMSLIVEHLVPKSDLTRVTAAAATTTMLLGFLLSLGCLHVAKYTKISDPLGLVEKMTDTVAKDSDFFDDRIIDYSLATSANAKANDLKAALVMAAGVCLLIGLVLHAVYFLEWTLYPGAFAHEAK